LFFIFVDDKINQLFKFFVVHCFSPEVKWLV